MENNDTKEMIKYLKYIVVAIVFSGVIIAAAIVYLAEDGVMSSKSESKGQTGATEDETGIDISGDPVMGEDDAPVTMIEFSDFGCFYCAKFAEETFPKIKEKYVDTGKLRVVFKTMAFRAPLVAEASDCANDQGKFWDFHNVVFGKVMNKEELPKEISGMDRIGADSGLQVDEFKSCLEEGKYKEGVQNDLAIGEEEGVQGTPMFMIGGSEVSGAQPYAKFEQAIEAELAKK